MASKRDRILKHILIISAFAVLAGTSCNARNDQMSSARLLIDDYRASLVAVEGEGGILFCENDTGGTNAAYQSCRSFENLNEQGCYGLTTYDMMQESNYLLLCQELTLLEQAKPASLSYLELNSIDWWKSLPAQIIPVPSGIYSPESLEEQRRILENFVDGKLLGDLEFIDFSADLYTFDAILSSRQPLCGLIEDHFHLEAILLADFDNDGISELLIKGFRSLRSETCLLGSGNSLGAAFTVIINKDSPAEVASLIAITR